MRDPAEPRVTNPAAPLATGSADAEVCVALCTAPDAGVAERLGRLAVEGRHAACANLIPGVRSLFRWQDALQDDPEVLVLFKTTRGAYPGLADLVSREHPYEVPELVTLDVSAGLGPYLGWVRESVGGPRGQAPPASVE